MTFTDIGVAHFGAFNHWVHFKEVKCPDSSHDHFPMANFLELGNLWLLGQRFLVPMFQNDVMDFLFHAAFAVTEGNHFCDFIKLAYNMEEDGRDMLRKVGIYRLSKMDRRFKEIALGDDLASAWKDMALELEYARVDVGERFSVAELREIRPPKASYFYVKGLE